MDAESRAFFDRLLTTPGVSGYEQAIQAVVREYAESFADHVTTDFHGNVIVTVNPDADLRVMLAGHCDQLGLLVSHIDEKGFIFFQTMGGWDPQQLVGQEVTLWTDSGPVQGAIARKAIHILDADERKKVAEFKNLWIDIGASDQEDAESVVQIGDTATVRLGIKELRNGLAMAPGMDNRTGVWVVMEALKRAAAKGVACAFTAVSTVQEEVGLRGAKTSAYGIDPHVGIAVDVTHATDTPQMDKRQLGAIDLGAGPVIPRGPNISPRVWERLSGLAKENDIPVQIAAMNRPAGNDANPIQVTRSGVATGIVQIPNRYMHSPVETIAWSDIDHAADLLAAFGCAAAVPGDFIP